jgi:valyl-tRNA synthetase
VLLNLEGYEPVEGPSPSAELSDRWIRSSLARTIDRVDEHQEKFRFSEVTRALYSFLWNDYCDWYVELAKPRLRGPAPERALAQEILVEVLEQALRLMHPVMPFITEAIWQALPRHAASGEAIMTAAWPAARSEDLDEAAMAAMTLVQEVVSAIRNIRGELRVPPGRRIDVKLSAGPASAELLGRNLGYVETLALAETAEVGSGFEKPPESASALVRDVEIHVPLEGLIDAGAERRRLKKEIDKLDRLLRGLDSKLNQSAFLERAPGEVVERERLRQTEYRESLARLEASLDAIGP